MLRASITARPRLSEDDLQAMLALHRQSFANVREACFRRDLAEKDWVLRLHDDGGTLAGFSTQQVIALTVAGRPVRFLYSGDTVVARAHWRTPLLAGCFGHLLLRLLEEYGEEAWYWFLISKGFRTYRFLPIFFAHYWPAPDRELPPDIARLLEAVARHRFGDAYQPELGIVRPVDGDFLVPALAAVPPGRHRDPHVAYFLRRNPGYAQGDELACLAPIRRDNLNASAWRVIHATRPTWAAP